MRKVLDEKARKKRNTKIKNTARRVVPFMIIAPASVIGAHVGVDFVSTPTHLYPLNLSASAKAAAAAAQKATASINQVAQEVNKTANALAGVANQSAGNQSAIGAIQNGITQIQNTPVPTLGPLASPAQNSQATSAPRAAGGASTPSANSPAPVIRIPTAQIPAATTRASLLG
ncbi:MULTISPECIES: hypothetical protein [Acidithrix]|uniref:Uncharacterized protein n=1 Tax=Acidithrix ferrooxidans TaxID=1280514 RepID=A0A0D8HMM6_9ACTN|nr:MULTISPECIES: hypothetical protein [Acidithrix]KJF18326.1 hypothetical protein AXFE_07140 [Acidithrix ferrooxidans]